MVKTIQPYLMSHHTVGLGLYLIHQSQTHCHIRDFLTNASGLIPLTDFFRQNKEELFCLPFR